MVVAAGLTDVNFALSFWTALTFLILLVVLGKFAWGQAGISPFYQGQLGRHRIDQGPFAHAHQLPESLQPDSADNGDHQTGREAFWREGMVNDSNVKLFSSTVPVQPSSGTHSTMLASIATLGLHKVRSRHARGSGQSPSLGPCFRRSSRETQRHPRRH